MSTMQKIVTWILILIGVFVLSDFLISVGINSTYKEIKREDNYSEVAVYQAQATYVNGRIRGLIKDPKKMEGKYLKVELYTKRNVLAGRTYIELQKTDEQNRQSFELFFKAQDVASYKVEIVEEKEIGEELNILPKEWTQAEVLLVTAMTFLILW